MISDQSLLLSTTVLNDVVQNSMSHHMRKFVLETEILGSCKKQIRQFVLIKIKELMRHSISRETNRIINLAKSAD